MLFRSKTLERRGPDNQGLYSDAFVGVGHRRLSIIDTSSAAHQPMWNESGRYAIIFNGAPLPATSSCLDASPFPLPTHHLSMDCHRALDAPARRSGAADACAIAIGAAGPCAHAEFVTTRTRPPSTTVRRPAAHAAGGAFSWSRSHHKLTTSSPQSYHELTKSSAQAYHERTTSVPRASCT